MTGVRACDADADAWLADRLTPLVSSVSSLNHTETRNIDERIAAASKRRENTLGKGDPLGGSISCYIDICRRTRLFECRQIGRRDDSRDFTEEERQFEAALRVTACREVCSKMGHAPFGK